MKKNKEKDDNFFKRVYHVVRTIPDGKVATYGQIAQMLGTKDARKVGWALNKNKDLSVPCHRVVNREGGLAENFAFEGGWREHKTRLVNEGISFRDEMHVNLEKHLWVKK